VSNATEPAALFPGQGSHTPEMRDLVAQRAPDLLERVTELVVDLSVRAALEGRLSGSQLRPLGLQSDPESDPVLGTRSYRDGR